MIHSSHRDRKAKAIAEALAMIADAHPELDRHRPRPVPETDEWLNSPESKTGLDLRPGSAAPPHALTPAAPSARHAP
jgi:hypothetical protein